MQKRYHGLIAEREENIIPENSTETTNNLPAEEQNNLIIEEKTKTAQQSETVNSDLLEKEDLVLQKLNSVTLDNDSVKQESVTMEEKLLDFFNKNNNGELPSQKDNLELFNAVSTIYNKYKGIGYAQIESETDKEIMKILRSIEQRNGKKLLGLWLNIYNKFPGKIEGENLSKNDRIQNKAQYYLELMEKKYSKIYWEYVKDEQDRELMKEITRVKESELIYPFSENIRITNKGILSIFERLKAFWAMYTRLPNSYENFPEDLMDSEKKVEKNLYRYYEYGLNIFKKLRNPDINIRELGRNQLWK